MTTLSRRIELPEASPPIIAAPRSHRTGARARLACQWPTPLTPVISAVGDIDASNVDNLTDYAIAHVSRCNVLVLVLDLTGLDFFAIEGHSALRRVGVCCARAGTSWAVMPGPAVTRVLRHCDPQGTLPIAGTIDEVTTALGWSPLGYTDTAAPDSSARRALSGLADALATASAPPRRSQRRGNRMIG